jgi:hypothetical protein
MLNQKGQSIVEYIVVWSALVATILVLAYGKLKPAVTTMMDTSAEVITTSMDKFLDAVD